MRIGYFIIALLLIFSALLVWVDNWGTRTIRKEVNNPEVVVIDGCEYLFVLYDHQFSITHKGNCTNHIRPRAVITTGKLQ